MLCIIPVIIAQNSETAIEKVLPIAVDRSDFELKLTQRDKELLKKLDMEHQKKVKSGKEKHVSTEAFQEKVKQNVDEQKTSTGTTAKITAVPNPKSKQKVSLSFEYIRRVRPFEPVSCKSKIFQLSSSAKQRKVPASRVSRMMSFGSLAAGLGIGTAAEYARRTLGIGDSSSNSGDLFMTPANMDRIVDTLCKVRGKK